MNKYFSKKSIIAGGLALIAMLSLFSQYSNVAYAVENYTEEDYAKEDMATKIQTYVEENNPVNAAVSISVVDKDQTLYQENFGFFNKKEELAADENTIYEWGSLSKVLTWISVMQLEEKGLLDLNEDIRTYLPENYLKKLKYDKSITMLDLMNHAGGWQDSITNIYSTYPSSIISLEEFLQKCEPVQLYEPGSTVAYSNWGTALAGLIVERVSGENYCDYVNAHIFAPLDMQRTSIDPLRNDNNFVKNGLEKVVGYDSQGKEIQGRYYSPEYPAAGVAGTAGDVEHLMKAFLGSSQYRLFEKDETRQIMLESTRIFPGEDASPEIAHGLWYDFYSTPSLGHYGNTVQFSTHMSISPEAGIGVIVMTNQAQEMKLNHGVGELLFGDGKTQKEGTAGAFSKEYKFKDYYTGAKTIEQGYCRFYHFMQIFKVKNTGEDTILLSSLGVQVPCRKIRDRVYRCESGFMEGFYFFLSVDEDGVVQKIATTTMDIIPYSAGKVVLDITTSILAGLALIGALIALIICIYKIGKKCSGYRIPLLMNLFSIGYYVMVVLEAMKLISTAAVTGDVLVYVIGYIVYLLAGTANLIWFLTKQKKNTVTILTAASSVCIIIYILYLQMFMI